MVGSKSGAINGFHALEIRNSVIWHESWELNYFHIDNWQNAISNRSFISWSSYKSQDTASYTTFTRVDLTLYMYQHNNAFSLRISSWFHHCKKPSGCKPFSRHIHGGILFMAKILMSCQQVTERPVFHMAIERVAGSVYPKSSWPVFHTAIERVAGSVYPKSSCHWHGREYRKQKERVLKLLRRQ